jgi:AcrR family transcriptional regulator
VTDTRRERILAAAVAEFGERGYAGARTASIASRAEVNSQLITYYFGGKRGLLDELRRRWAAKQAEVSAGEHDLGSTVAAWFEATWSEPDWARLMIWQALETTPEELSEPLAQQQERLGAGIERMRRRQQAGEITTDVDPEFLTLLSYALAFAPIALPHIVSALFGDDPEAYRARWAEQLTRLLQPSREQ